MPYWLSLLTALIGFAIAAVTGFALIPYLKKLHFGQTILDIGPKWHKSKQGTPIMGGFMFIIGSVISAALGYTVYRLFYTDMTFEDLEKNALRLLAVVLYALFCSAIGFADDYIKAVKKQNLGLKAKQKLVFQILFSALFLAALYALGDRDATLNLVFTELYLGVFYYPLMVLVMVFLMNAVNLTDGVDGLCGTVTVVSMLALSVLAGMMREYELNLYAVALAGGCIGFLLWNLNPAKCFMGDTGSMYLGGAFTALSLALGSHLLMVMIGIVYICEAGSVVLQVISFKTTGKRIFKMSPIHHHFEMSGFSEYKIVITFSLFGLVFAAGAVAIHMLA